MLPKYHRDGRFEGGTRSPEYYKYAFDELECGNWKDGLQSIEEFEWDIKTEKMQENDEVEPHDDIAIDTQDGRECREECIQQTKEDIAPAYKEDSIPLKSFETAKSLLEEELDIQREIEAQKVENGPIETTLEKQADNAAPQTEIFVDTTGKLQSESTAITSAPLDTPTNVGLDAQNPPENSLTVLEVPVLAQPTEEVQQIVDKTISGAPRKTANDKESVEGVTFEEIAPTQRPIMASSSPTPKLAATPDSPPWIPSPRKEIDEHKTLQFSDDTSISGMTFDVPELSAEDLEYLGGGPTNNVCPDANNAVHAEKTSSLTSPQEITPMEATTVGATPQLNPTLEQEEKDGANDTIVNALSVPFNSSHAGSERGSITSPPLHETSSLKEDSHSPWACDFSDLPERDFGDALEKYLARDGESPATRHLDLSIIRIPPRIVDEELPASCSKSHLNASNRDSLTLHPSAPALLTESSSESKPETQRIARAMTRNKRMEEIEEKVGLGPSSESEDELLAATPAQKKQKTTKMSDKETPKVNSEKKTPAQAAISVKKQGKKVEGENADMEGKIIKADQETNNDLSDIDPQLDGLSSDPLSPFQPRTSSPATKRNATPKLPKTATRQQNEHSPTSAYSKRHTRSEAREESDKTSALDAGDTTPQELINAENFPTPHSSTHTPRTPLAAIPRKRKSATVVSYTEDPEYGDRTPDAEKAKVSRTEKTAMAKGVSALGPATKPKPKPKPRIKTTRRGTASGSSTLAAHGSRIGTPAPIEFAGSSSPVPSLNSGRYNKYGFKMARFSRTDQPSASTTTRTLRTGGEVGKDSEESDIPKEETETESKAETSIKTSTLPKAQDSEKQKTEDEGKGEGLADGVAGVEDMRKRKAAELAITENALEDFLKDTLPNDTLKFRQPATENSAKRHGNTALLQAQLQKSVPMTCQQWGSEAHKLKECAEADERDLERGRISLTGNNNIQALEEIAEMVRESAGAETAQWGKSGGAGKTATTTAAETSLVRGGEMIEGRQTRRRALAREELERAREAERNIARRTRSAGVKK